MTIDSDTFRSVLGRFASGVTIVTTRDAALADHGMTVSAFCSASLEPPLVLACIDREASMLPVIEVTPQFGVSILSAAQEHISRRFSGVDVDRFDGIGYTRGQSGVALLDDALAHLECRIVDRHWAGDHLVIVGRVETAAAFAERPLLYYRGGYAHLER